MSIENCLPESARAHCIRVRNQKLAAAREEYDTKLIEMRAVAAARGVLRSGHQELAEWKLREEFLSKSAYGWFQAAIETCALYGIPLDQQRCKCIENGIGELLVAQYQNLLRQADSGVGDVKIPASASSEITDRTSALRFPIFNTILIDLEKARVESQRQRREHMPRSLSPEEVKVLAVLSDSPEQFQLDQLAEETSMQNDRAGLLRAIDRLRIRGFIKFVRLKDNNGLIDAANITVLPAGITFVEEAESSNVAQSATASITMWPPVPKNRHSAIVIRVLIASPSDVGDERDVATKVIHAWNAAYWDATGIMLHPVRWETHTFPASGERPQAIVNKQIGNSGDLLIGIFGYRLGTPTGEAQSGTIEEIELFRKAGKYVALYFSTAHVPRDADREQLKALEDYQRERKKDTLYFEFSSPEELQQLLTQHLPNIVREVLSNLRAGGELEELEDEIQKIESNSELQLSKVAVRPQAPDDKRLSVKPNLTFRRVPVPGGGDDERFLINAGVENDGDEAAPDFQLVVELPGHFVDGGGYMLQRGHPSQPSLAHFEISNNDEPARIPILYPGRSTRPDLISFHVGVLGHMKRSRPEELEGKITATVYSGSMKPQHAEIRIADMMKVR